MVGLKRKEVVPIVLSGFTGRYYDTINDFGGIATSYIDFIRAKDYLQLVRLHNIVIPILGSIVHFMGTNVLKQQRDSKW